MPNPHARPPLSPLAMLRSLWSNRRLTARLARRDIAARYRGSFGGLLWAVVQPLLMLAVYTFVFSVVFQARWGEGLTQSRTEFAIVLFAGLLVHALVAETWNAAPALVLANANYVKKVVFPLEVLPVIALAVALFQCLIGVLVLLAAMLVLQGGVPATAPLIIFTLVPLVLLTLGGAWALAALGVYVRDTAQITQIFTNILLFVSPVFFPISAIPEDLRWALRCNPLSFLMGQARDALVWGKAPDWGGLLIFTAGAFLFAWLGYAFFQATRKGFADVL